MYLLATSGTAFSFSAIPLTTIVRSVTSLYPKRTILGLALFIGQAFLHNSILFGLGACWAPIQGLQR